MHDWRRVRLGDVAAEVTVGHVGTMACEYEESGVPFLRSQNIRPHRIEATELKYINVDFHRRLKKSSLQPGDVVTVRTGKPGQTAVIPDWMPTANCSDLVITRPGPELNARWLSYYMNWVVDSHISGHLVGAVQQHFNVKSAKSLELLLPFLAEQRAIAKVLGSLDDKIAANERLVGCAEALMVAQARTAFRRTTVAELAQQQKTALSPGGFEAEVVHFSLPAFDEGKTPEVCSGSSIKSNKTVISEKCVLVSKLNPRIPRIWDVSTLPDRMSLASTEFVALIPELVSSSVLCATLSDPSVSVALAANVAGTSGSHQRVRPAELLALEVNDPRSLTPDAQRAITELGSVCHLRRMESSQLRATRDELLPLLMSGKVRVRDAEKVLSDAL